MIDIKNSIYFRRKTIHPFEYRKRFPKAVEAFDTIWNKEKIVTFHSKVELQLLQRNVRGLKTRPGELARRLDYLLRIAEEPSHVINTFAEVADEFLLLSYSRIMLTFFTEMRSGTSEPFSQKDVSYPSPSVLPANPYGPWFAEGNDLFHQVIPYGFLFGGRIRRIAK